MSRTLLGVLAAVVLVAGVVLFVLLGKSSSTPATTTKTTAPDGTEITTTTGGTPTPSLPQLGSAPSVGGPRETTVGGMKVRDHRRGDSAPIDIPPNVHPPGSVEIPPTLTQALAGEVKAVMRECMKTVPATSRGESPKLEGQITIAVKDQKASVTKSIVQLRDMKEGDAVTAAKQCIESKSIGLFAPASDVPNLDAYSINLSFIIPKT